jgi:membrane protease YdiL (CAAX protease family)
MNRINSLIARIGAPEAAPPWALSAALVAPLFAFVALIAGSGVALVWAGERDYTGLAGWTLGAILIGLFVRQTRRHDWTALRLVAASTPILFVMFIAFGCALAFDLVSLAVTREFLPKPELLGLNPSVLGVLEWSLAIAFMVILQPIAEGLVFRGIAIPALGARLGAWGGIFAAAALAGIFHLLIYSPNYATASSFTPLWYGLAIPILEAILFGAVRGYTGSTRASIAAQIAFGLFAVLKLLALVG